MRHDIHERIKENPKFQTLCAKRTAFSWTLSAIMLAVYYAFILTIAFDKELLGTPVSEGSVTTVGIYVGMLIIVLAFVLTGIYVRRANGEFDALTRQLLDEVK